MRPKILEANNTGIQTPIKEAATRIKRDLHIRRIHTHNNEHSCKMHSRVVVCDVVRRIAWISVVGGC